MNKIKAYIEKANLDEHEINLLVKLLCQIAFVDGNLDLNETGLIAKVCVYFEVNLNEMGDLYDTSIADLISEITELEKEKVAVIAKFAIIMMGLDGVYHDNEKRIVNAFAVTLDVEPMQIAIESMKLLYKEIFVA